MTFIIILLGTCLMLSIMSMVFLFSALVVAGKADGGSYGTEENMPNNGDSHLVPSKKSAHLVRRGSY